MKQYAWQQKVQVQKPSVDRGDKNFHLQQPNICRGNRTTTSRNQTFIVATEGSTYSNHNVQCGNRVATYSNQIFVVAIECFAYSNQNDQCGNRVAMCCNHKDSVAIEDPSIAMLLMRGNRFYCSNHCRCQCTYCHSLCMWQYVYLTTPSVLQQLQHPRWLVMLWLETLHSVATTHHCVAIGENLLQHLNKPLRKPIATTSAVTPPSQIFVLYFCLFQPFLAYCNTFRLLHQGSNLVVKLGLGSNLANLRR